jgi:hypothetical protein
MCGISEYNCSHANMTSPATMAELLHLPIDNPKLFAEFSSETHEDSNADKETNEPTFEDYDDADDSAVLCRLLRQHILGWNSDSELGVGVNEAGYLELLGTAEDTEVVDEDVVVTPRI